LAGVARRGDLFLCSFNPDPELNEGDFDRVAEANGEVAPAKDSKPVRFVDVGAGICVASVVSLADAEDFPFAEDGGPVANTGEVCDILLAVENMFAPFTLAKGELEDTYAMKPP
jgi:hypothetical protein